LASVAPPPLDDDGDGSALRNSMLSTVILNASIVVPDPTLRTMPVIYPWTATNRLLWGVLLSHLSLQLHVATKEWCAWTDCWLAAWNSLDDGIHIRLDVGSPSASSQVAVGCEPCDVGIRTMGRLQTGGSKGDGLCTAMTDIVRRLTYPC
jgi:hypothetical protein